MRICQQCYGELKTLNCEDCENDQDAYFESLSDKKLFAPELENITWEKVPSSFIKYKED